ncbi:MAG: hypothetical protein EZS28_026522 [Streblomastix strix]|uniref:Right handed beta helix domain-containing protein n=1 Tax=Streblomastix strix TaxID=222440 RepID=A0A5J4V6X5_9EUKA|nr:MAG: hypothetical protein EZS28_026522 [Streblomastix strix]
MKSPNLTQTLEQELCNSLDIILTESEHLETIHIMKTTSVKISGNAFEGKRTKILGPKETDAKGEYIITVDSTSTGDIIVQNIDMREWNGGFISSDGGKSILLKDSLLAGGGTIIHNTDGVLNIQSDEFIGDGINVPIDPFIFATKGSVNIVSSTFKKGSFKGDRNGCIVCCGTVTQCTIDGCEFIENKFNSGSAAVSVTTPTCIQLIIKGTPSKRTKFSGLDMKNPLNGNFIKTVSSKISISYADFVDSTFTESGNAVTINEQQASEISLIWCNFTNLRTNSVGQFSTCINSMLSSENGFQFNAEYCTFSDCRYSGLSQVSGNAITIQSQSSDRSAVRTIRFTECIFTNNRGNGYGGAFVVDVGSKCTTNFISSFFNENSGTEANDIWIRSTNSQSELNISNFNTSYSDSVQSHIITINEEQESTYNLNHFPGVIFVSNKTISVTRDGSRDKPYLKIKDSFPKLNYTSKPVNMPRTIYILDEIWDESLYDVSFANSLIFKSGLNDDSMGNIIKPTWITTAAGYNTTIFYHTGYLTLESLQFNFTNVSGSIRPYDQLIWIQPTDLTINLTIISCIFNGLGVDGNSVKYLIAAQLMKRMSRSDNANFTVQVTGCTFDHCTVNNRDNAEQ